MPTDAWLDLAELTAAQVGDVAPEAVLLIGLGSLEQHGPRLPMGTDTFAVETVLTAARQRWTGPGVVIEAPSLPYGASEHHLFAGALSLSPTLLIDVLGSVIRTAIRTGFRRVIFVNGHGGNSAASNIAIADAAVQHHGAFVAVDYWRLIDQRAVRSTPAPVPGHAGEFESAVVEAGGRHVDRSQVDEDSSGLVLFDERFHGIAAIAVNGDWQHAGGVSDHASHRDALDGTHLVDSAATRLVRLIEDLRSLG